MRKKILLIIGALICITAGTSFFAKALSSPSYGDYCPFCDPTVIKDRAFYEDDLVFALCTHKPIFPGHCLIIPKKHLERFEMLTDPEMVEIGKVIKKVNLAAMREFGTSSYLLHQKNGIEVGQSVPHIHFHYLPRKAGDNSYIKLILKMLIANAKDPINTDETVKKLRTAMSNS